MVSHFTIFCLDSVLGSDRLNLFIQVNVKNHKRCLMRTQCVFVVSHFTIFCLDSVLGSDRLNLFIQVNVKNHKRWLMRTSCCLGLQ